MSEPSRDGNEMQRERSESRLRNVAAEEIARALEQVGVDIRTHEGRRDLRVKLDYLDELYGGQEQRRLANDWTRDMMAMQPSARSVLEWGGKRMKAEEANREAVRKTIVEKATGAVLWIIFGSGLGALLLNAFTKGHAP